MLYGIELILLEVVIMSRTDEDVAKILVELYAAKFGGRQNQRFLISWSDIRSLYGFDKLFTSRIESLMEAAMKQRLYLWDLGESNNVRMAGVIKIKTVDRWRRVPKKVIEDYMLAPDNTDEEISEDDEN